MEALAEVSGEHRLYRNKRTNFLYVHDFPKDRAFEESFDEVRKKYERRVRRLYEEIEKARRALLICIGEGGDMDYVRLADMLRERCGKKVDLLVIEHHDDIASPEMQQLCGYVEVWRLRVYDPPEARDEEWWAGNSEFLRPVLSRYAIHVPWWRRKMVIKVLCAFVPLPKWRKKLRGMIQPKKSWN